MNNERVIREFGAKLVDWIIRNTPDIQPGDDSIYLESRVSSIVSMVRKIEMYKSHDLREVK